MAYSIEILGSLARGLSDRISAGETGPDIDHDIKMYQAAAGEADEWCRHTAVSLGNFLEDLITQNAAKAMDIKLLSLRLKNFKGVESFELDIDGQNATVTGRNGAGKSTLADGLAWLLFDKNAAGESKFGLKPTGSDGQELHNLEHEVDAALRIIGSSPESEGTIYSQDSTLTLKKTLVEKWVKKRGQSAQEFAGHETAYTIDGVPKSKKEYDEVISGIAPEQIFRMLTSATFFNAMKWQDRRTVLLDVAGDVTDEDVFAGHPKLLPLKKSIPSGRTLIDHVKVLKADRKRIVADVDGITPRIDEVSRTVPEASEMVPPKTARSYGELQNDLKQAQQERAALLAGDTTDAREQVLRLKEKMSKEDQAYHESVRKAQAERANGMARVEQCGVSIKRLEGIIEQCHAQITALEQTNERFRSDWIMLDSGTAPEAICVTCGQDLPADQAEEIRAKFMERKAEEMKKIQETGTANKAEIEKLKTEIVLREAEHAGIVDEQEEAQEAVDAIAMPEAPDHEMIQDLIAGIEGDIAKMATPDSTKVDAEIAEIEASIKQYDAVAERQKVAAAAEKRITGLKADQKRLGIELDKIDAEIMLVEDFTRAKVLMLTDAVDSKFAPLSFKLFAEQINGGLAETCEVLRDGVPYGDLSRGQKAVAGLQIIKVLSGHYGITAPVFVDDAEGITLDLPTVDGGQYISLVAADRHDGITVEIEQAEEATA
jgi:energy-coupling factor transporter ATP-binding protein EcfA2